MVLGRNAVRGAVALAGALVALGAGCQLAEPELGSRQGAIVNGAPTTGDAAVVALVHRGQSFCTGTLVGRRTVVTAAHCLPPHIDLRLDDIEVFFGSRLGESGGFTMPVVDGLAHPSWSPERVAGDIGLLALAHDAPAEPVAMAYDDLSILSVAGDPVRLVGFGITARDGAGGGTKREGMAMVEAIDASSLYLDPGPASTCNGDSGGPLFLQQGGAWVFAGIHSRSDCDRQQIAERLDVHVMDFVQPFTEEHEGAGSCAADGYCALGCEDADPDCPCAEDGLCTEACTMPELDRDCSAACATDGVCDESCEVDADCGCDGDACEPAACTDDDCDPAGLAGGCAAAGAGGGGWLVLLAAFGLLRRPRQLW